MLLRKCREFLIKGLLRRVISSRDGTEERATLKAEELDGGARSGGVGIGDLKY